MIKTVFFTLFLLFLEVSSLILEIEFVPALTLKLGNNLYAQPKYPYKEHKDPDRNEGITEEIELVSGERVVLLSCTIENNELIMDVQPQSFTLAFYLYEPARINIEIKEIDHFYLMRPLQRRYDKGINRFSWPTEIPNYYNISLNVLLPLAKIYDSNLLTIVPILLYADRLKTSELIYNFCFISQKTVSTLKYRIYNHDTNELVYYSSLHDIEYDEQFHIRWDGKNRKKVLQKSDLYYLNLEVIFEPDYGEKTGLTIWANYNFYHNQELLITELFDK